MLVHGQTIKEMFVPEELLQGVVIYRRVEEERKRPTIEELEQLLNSEEDEEIFVNRDGSVSAS